MPRPRKIENPHKVVVYLGAKTHEMARTIGAGNVSEGIRQAVSLTYASRETERLRRAIADGKSAHEAVGARRASEIQLKKPG